MIPKAAWRLCSGPEKFLPVSNRPLSGHLVSLRRVFVPFMLHSKSGRKFRPCPFDKRQSVPSQFLVASERKKALNFDRFQ